MFDIGGWEWIILLVIVLIVFGVGRLPEIGGALGKSIREFRQASREEGGDTTGTTSEAVKPAAASAEAKVEEKPEAHQHSGG